MKNYFLFCLCVYLFLLVFKDIFKMTFWDFISKPPSRNVIVISSIIFLILTGTLIFLKYYCIEFISLVWYLQLIILLITIGCYYLLVSLNMWLFMNFLDKVFRDKTDTYLRFKITWITAYAELIIFIICAYFFIDSAKLFWVLFFGLQVYRIPIFIFANYLTKRY
jgi:hypothetical protein